MPGRLQVQGGHLRAEAAVDAEDQARISSRPVINPTPEIRGLHGRQFAIAIANRHFYAVILSSTAR